MSYCRFGWNGSEVYVYESATGFECCGCHIVEGGVTLGSPEEMIAHLIEHRKQGSFVPEYAITGLWSEISGADKPSRPEPKELTKSRLMIEGIKVDLQVKRFTKRRKFTPAQVAAIKKFAEWTAKEVS